MATTKITSNVLAPNAAQNNINSGASFSVSIPTQFTNTLTTNSSVIIDSPSSVANPKLLILSTSGWGNGDDSALVIKGSGVNKVASINLRATGGSGELYNGWLTGRVGSGIVVNNSFFVNNGGSGPQTGTAIFAVLNSGKVGVGTSTPISNLDVFGSLATSTPTDVLILTRSFNSGVAFSSAASFKLSNPATSTTNTRLDISLLNANSSVPIAPDTTVMSLVSNGNVGIGTTTPSEKLTVSGNIIASNDITASNNIIANGTANKLPNQTATTSSDIITRSLSDFRHSNRNKRITDDTTFTQNVWEQFIDFDDQYNADLVIANASGTDTFSISPAVFGDVWNASNVSVTFQGNDQYTHRGIFLLRGSLAGNRACYVGVNRPTNSYVLSQLTNEFTCRVFVKSYGDFATQGYLKIGPIPKGGTGGGDSSLNGGLIFNPYLHPTNLVIGVTKTGVTTPFTFTTNPANVDFIDTGLNFVNLLDRWVNITYKMDYSTAGQQILQVTVVRENVTLFTETYNIATDPVISTWARKFNLYSIGASTEIGLQFGKFTYTNRSEMFFDYIYYKTTGVSSAPSNWNSLRF